MRYEVIVSNVGSVYAGDSESVARRTFDSYKHHSKMREGRAAGESVTLTCDGEPIAEHAADDFELP